MASSLSVIANLTPPSHNKHCNQHQHQHHMDRLDAARALLGVSPAPSNTNDQDGAVPLSPKTSRLSTSFGRPLTSRTFFQQPSSTSSSSSPPLLATALAGTLSSSPPSTSTSSSHNNTNRKVSFETQPPVPPLAPPAVVLSNGLDALAALASNEQASWMARAAEQEQQQRLVSASASSSEDEDAMPPPPPRGRRRSVSNPEGMEKWAPMSSTSSSAAAYYNNNSRRHFVLPASILEEELAEASAAMEAHERKHSMDQQQQMEEEEDEEDDEEEEDASLDHNTASKAVPISGMMTEEEQANLTPEELLKRARSRLLEDLSEGSLNGEKGVLTLPHSLSKYKEVYNKNGRIGIYTPAERAAIIARFQQKRSRRVWNKKIRYNCRKNLADRRMRVKGRFVKRSTEQQAKEEEAAAEAAGREEETTQEGDQDMPDVNDPEAGFCPTDDQPYRRTRRHTIT